MVGSVEDFVAKRRETTAEAVSDFHRKIIGSAVRLEIPLTNEFQMRAIADLLRGFAERIDHFTRRQDLELWQRLSALKTEARMVQVRIREIVDSAGGGKSPRPYRRNMD